VHEMMLIANQIELNIDSIFISRITLNEVMIKSLKCTVLSILPKKRYCKIASFDEIVVHSVTLHLLKTGQNILAYLHPPDQRYIISLYFNISLTSFSVK